MIAAIGCVRLNLVKLPIFGWDLHCSTNGTEAGSSDLILYFRMSIFFPLSEPSFPLQICADYSHLSSNHHPSPGTTQSIPHSIFGDQESPRFFLSHRLAQVFKAPEEKKSCSLPPEYT
jgi:hypothetical protein